MDSDIEYVDSDVDQETVSDHQGRSHHSHPPVHDIQWRSFSGLQNENVTAFVQHVHQTAFMYERTRDGEWTAQYAIACLTGSALLWACELDARVQRNWSRLRAELLRRYTRPDPPADAGQSEPLATPTQQGGPNIAPPLELNIFRDHQNTRARRGCIEVIDDQDGRIIGYLSATDGGTISPTRNGATIVEIPNSPAYEDPFHMLIIERYTQGEPLRREWPQRDFPYLGVMIEPLDLVALAARSRAGQLTPMQCQLLLQQQQTLAYNGHPLGPPNSPLNTKWVFKDCARSRPGDRIYKRRSNAFGEGNATASAEIWKVFRLLGGSEELRVFWTENDLATSELGVYYSQGVLVLHKISNPAPGSNQLMLQQRQMQGLVGTLPESRRVRLVFHSINPHEQRAPDFVFS
ncbi:hypothetical protein FRB99_000507 [Tulasnella sp. 403]|nr:hypothetical protein FRB99_000507 [Tulasnella sp. 403]